MNRLKAALLFFFIMPAIFILMPFANGLGCNFTFQEKSEHVNKIGKCKSGVLTSYYKSSGGGASYNRYVYGTFWNTFYLVKINKEHVRPSSIVHPSMSLEENDEHVFSLYDSDRLYISKYFCANHGGECFVITDDAIENVYKMTFHGRLGFF